MNFIPAVIRYSVQTYKIKDMTTLRQAQSDMPRRHPSPEAPPGAELVVPKGSLWGRINAGTNMIAVKIQV